MFTQRLLMPRTPSPATAAILLMILATLLTSVGMVMNKFMVLNQHSPDQIVFWRSCFSIIPLLFLIKRQGGLKSLETSQPRLLITRGIMGFLSMVAYCFSLEYLSLFSAESLLHLEPIFVYIMAIFFLRETFHKSSLIALAAAGIGIFTIMSPGRDVASIGGGLATLCALFYAIEIILTRVAGAKDSAVTMFAYYTMVCLLGSGATMLVQGFTWPELSEIPGFVLLAFINLGINLAFTGALRRAPASRLAPLEYLTLAWVTLWQIQIWGETPSLPVVVGALIILASGLWILKRSLHINPPNATAD